MKRPFSRRYLHDLATLKRQHDSSDAILGHGLYGARGFHPNRTRLPLPVKENNTRHALPCPGDRHPCLVRHAGPDIVSVEEFLSDAFHIEISLGSLKNIEDRMSEALAEVVKQVHDAVKEADPVHADETSWKEKGKRATSGPR